MARIRTVKPELRTSLTAADWPREIRYAWVLLFGYLDDHGRGLDDLRLIVADLFPLDQDMTHRKMDKWLDLMSQQPPGDDVPALCRYQVGGRRFLHAPKWTQHQKVAHPRASRIPPCPDHPSRGFHEDFMKDSRGSPETLANSNGAPPEAFATVSRPRARPGDAPAIQGREGNREGKGIPTSSGAAAPIAITAQTIAAAWIEACRDGTGAEPSRSQVGQVARLAKELLASNDAGRVLAAARSAGAGGFATIDRELTAQAGRQRAAPTAWAPLPVDQTTGRPVDFR